MADPAATESPGGPGAFQATDTGRVEAFSDGVFAVAITILALELATPAHRDGGLLSALLHQWPVYLGYLTSFVYIAVIWLNHHQAFTRIRVVDRGLHVSNLLLLLTTAALPFPTRVLSDTLQEPVTSGDVRTAVALYALVAAAMCAAWVWIYVQLNRRPGLLTPGVEPHYVPQGLIRSAAGVAAYLLGGGLGWAVTPGVALGVFLLLPLFYFATSEGIRSRTPVSRRR
ncbi:TMEM175 family protein [Streptomyces sp. 150FB]|uniref:TMEM175 family protein n=1 Tax=Streptomyces sp. 150FB TaxID=1576605 RepID=UPI0006964F10|nr:TMEM175 family protein [Streptomyces sp. 150FB]